MRNRWGFLFAFLLIIATAYDASAEVELRGAVRKNRPGGPPLAGVEISSLKTNPFETTNSGQFVLEFPYKPEQEKQTTLACAKNGMEVVNDMDLDVILNAKTVEMQRPILMCKEGDRDIHAAYYYRIEIEAAIESNYQGELKEIKEKYAEDLARKNRAIAKLQDERDKAMSLSEDYAQKFTDVRRETASELYKEAYRLFQAGDIKGALAVLDDARMEEARRRAREEMEKSIETYMLKARLLVMDFQFEKAEKFYRIAIEDGPDKFENIFEFALYMQKQNKHFDALELYQDALAVAERKRSEEQIADVMNNLGALQSDLNDYPSAEKSFQRALEIREKLARENPNAYLPYVANTLNNLGVFYWNRNDYPSAEKSYQRALEIYEKLARENPNTYLPYVANTLNNLGVFYWNRNDYPSAEKSYQRALEIREKIARENPNTYLPDVAMTLNNLGVFYWNLNDYPSAEKSYQRALEIREKIARENPNTYLPDVAMTLNNLGVFYRNLNDYPSAEKSFQKALEIREKLARENLNTYLPDVAMTLNNLGLFYVDLNDYPSAEKSFQRALEIREKIARENPNTYLPDVAMTLNNLGVFYRNLNDYPSAEKSFQRTIKISQKFLQKNPDNPKIISHLAGAHGSLSFSLLFDKRFKEAEDHAEKGLKLDPSQEWIQTNLASAHLFQGNFEQAREIYLTFRDQPLNDKTFREVFLEDLDVLEEAGVTHPDIQKARELLQ